MPVETIESNSVKSILTPKYQSLASPSNQDPESESTKTEYTSSLSLLNQIPEPELRKEPESRASLLKLKSNSEKEPIQAPEQLKLEPELSNKERVPLETVVEASPISDIQPSSSEVLTDYEKITPEKVIPAREESLEPSEEEDDEDDIRELEGRTVSAGGQQVLWFNITHLLSM